MPSQYNKNVSFVPKLSAFSFLQNYFALPEAVDQDDLSTACSDILLSKNCTLEQPTSLKLQLILEES
jgi:hypothetical protein